MKLILMEANTNREPGDIIQIQHQTASWQVCWWAQTRLRVETRLLLYDILNFCPTKSSRILSGLENLPFPPLEAERVKDGDRGCSERVKHELLSPQTRLGRSVLTVRTVPTDLLHLFEYSHTQLHTSALNACQVLPQTSSLHPVCQQVWVHTINLDWESGRRDGGGESTGGGRGGKVGQRT